MAARDWAVACLVLDLDDIAEAAAPVVLHKELAAVDLDGALFITVERPTPSQAWHGAASPTLRERVYGDAKSAADWVPIGIASAALLVSIGFGLPQNRKSERSAGAAERSVVAAERLALAAEQSAATSDRSSSSSDRSAAASETSATAAAQSAAEAAELRRIEADRDHDDRFRPKLGDELKVEIEEDGSYRLKGSLTFPRAYRVKAIGITGENSSTPLNLDRAVKPGRPYEFHVANFGNDGSLQRQRDRVASVATRRVRRCRALDVSLRTFAG